MKYIDHADYVDLPQIYGKHAPYWRSLSAFEKLRTIRQVGLGSFLHEVSGFADTERVQSRLESEYNKLSKKYEQTSQDLYQLKSENERLQRELRKSAEELESLKRVYARNIEDVVDPPSASDIFYRNNSEHWFETYSADRDTGTVRLIHHRKFYPCETIVMPLGTLRVRDRQGYLANLTQCYSYETLSPKKCGYGTSLLPDGYWPYKIRVLFGAEHGDEFWLQDPRYAQSVMLEVWTNYTNDSPGHHAMPAEDDPVIVQWKADYRGEICFISGRERQFNFITSFEKFLNSGAAKHSQREIGAIRECCYTEYLDHYFR